MELSNKTYDVIKDLSTIILPALATLVLTLAGVWNIPYGEAIAATITAIAVFLGAIVKISSATYNANEDKAIEHLLDLRQAAEDLKDDHEPHRGQNV